MIVRVATDIAANRLFDYAVPQELTESIRIGQRVRVPFGSREADAYVIEIIPESSPPGSADSLVRPGPGSADSLVRPENILTQASLNPSQWTQPTAAFLDAISWHKRGYLPHFDNQHAIQFITFRLADSLPAEVLAGWRQELKLNGKEPTADPRCVDLRKRIETFVDNGYGSCHLAKPEIAKIVQDCLLHFHQSRYILFAWSIMPNHVHVLMQPVEGTKLSGIIKTWKCYTAHECNKCLGTAGDFWEADYFDRFIRTPEHYINTVRYIAENPIKTGVSGEWTAIRAVAQVEVSPVGEHLVGGQDCPRSQGQGSVGGQDCPRSQGQGSVGGQDCPRSQEQAMLFDLQPDHKPSLKALLSVDAETTYLTEKLIELTRWMAGYYCAPFELTLRCALPAAVRNRDMRAKEQLYVQVGGRKEQVGGRREKGASDAAPLTPRQVELLANVRRVGGGWLQPLLHEFSCTTATLRKLEEKGFITIEPRQMRRDPLANRKVMPSKPLTLNEEQAKALEKIVGLIDRSDQSDRTDLKVKPLLLYGVTGSGKTEVYLQAISHALEQGKGAIVLVPEIALTPQTVQRFAARFGQRIAVLHSALSEGERFDEWHRIRTGEAQVVVGPRSALFAPVRKLGIIIVDEEHEPSYKQDETPRYHARDVAVMRGHLESCVVVLGTATPSMETWLNVQKAKYAVAHLTCRVANRPMPRVHVVDMRLGKAKLFSTELLDAMHLRLERGEQTILFLNRRGHSNSLVCPSCGHAPSCDQCSVTYTYHRSDNCLRCHVCGSWKHVPATCPACSDPAFRYAGFGTQKVEDTLKKIFSKARVLRMDADVTTRKSSHDEILGLFKSGHADILIGTQMIAKGLDFPNVTLVGVLSADMSLHIPDFRAGERTYQLLAQVSGRAGRDELPGEVYVQTFTPDHPAIQAAASKEEAFVLFAERELAERQAGQYPPYTHLVCLGLKGASEERVKFAALALAKELKAREKVDPSNVRTLERSNFRTLELPNFRTSDAYPAPLAKAKGLFRYQIILRASATRLMTLPLRDVLQKLSLPKEITLSIDVDALNMG